MGFGGCVRRALPGILASSAMAFAIGLFARASRADTAAFDLVGPRVEMRVTRAGLTLPISEVTNLRAGDRLWIQTDLPADQSVHYLLVVGFLQGPTNPPPEKWFTEAETWDKHFRQEGIVVTVPPRAQQALLLLAPETGGGFSAVRDAVRSKPGVFVRAARDLNEAGQERARLDTYLSAVRSTSETDPQELQKSSALLARTLSVKLDQDCFNQPLDQQEACLVQGKDQLLIQDNSGSMVASLTSGPSADLIGAVSSAPIARGGYYSPYVGSVVDLVRIMGSLRSPNYEYIPALSIEEKEEMNLRLNAPPSFHNPKSVLVVALPPVKAVDPPAMRPVDPKEVYCLNRTSLVLPVTGAPLAYATKLGHDYYLQLKDKTGKDVNLPAVPDATRGGFVVDTSSLHVGEMNASVEGTLKGTWGFQPFKGPTFHFRTSQAATWTLPRSQQAGLVVGHDDKLAVHSPAAVCVESVAMQYASDKPVKLQWKAEKQGQIAVTLPLKGETPGPFRLLVSQYGLAKPDVLELRAYADEAKLDQFRIHAGDVQGVLIGARLDEVAKLELGGVRFDAGEASHHGSDGQLQLIAQKPAGAEALRAGAALTASVTLKDGRVIELPTIIEAPRPKVTLMSVSVAGGSAASFLHLGNSQELPQDGSVVFALKSDVPAEFPRAEKIEVATADDSSDVVLSVERGNLIFRIRAACWPRWTRSRRLGPRRLGRCGFVPWAGTAAKETGKNWPRWCAFRR